ncbi:MAG: ABC transporter substrate-binding protein [Anaerolineae bacterium]|nr:ABC transporter substrate-binding protein [Anaerolineae bacterium]
MNKHQLLGFLSMVLLGGLLASCIQPATTSPLGEPDEVTFVLDWVPNTNHTGIFVAQEKGYFAEEGLNVNIIQPGATYAWQAVAGGSAEFGVSFQEETTLSRAGEEPAPIVSIAAIIQHNTSGFASLAERDIESPKDWEGLRYGSYGGSFDEPTVRVLMECAGGDFSKLEIVTTGSTDPLALVQAGQVDLAWIFYGWQGIQAKQQGADLSTVMMSDYFDCIPDYYTPILITSQAMIDERPDVVRAFLKAVSRGYDFAIRSPDEAVDFLLKAAPEIDKELAQESQAWLSPRYQSDAPRWGEQKLEVWQDYSQWMADNGIIGQPIDAQAAFTNDFLP